MIIQFIFLSTFHKLRSTLPLTPSFLLNNINIFERNYLLLIPAIIINSLIEIIIDIFI